MDEFLKSREYKKMQLHLVLSLILLSVVSTVKGAVNAGNELQLLECLSIGVSAFLIAFMGMFGNEKNFNDWRQIFSKKSTLEKLFFLIMPMFLILFILSAAWLVDKLPDFFASLRLFFKLPEQDFVIIKITKVFDYGIIIIWNFFVYFCVSMSIAMELTFVSVIYFYKIGNYYRLQIGED